MTPETKHITVQVSQLAGGRSIRRILCHEWIHPDIWINREPLKYADRGEWYFNPEKFPVHTGDIIRVKVTGNDIQELETLLAHDAPFSAYETMLEDQPEIFELGLKGYQDYQAQLQDEYIADCDRVMKQARYSSGEFIPNAIEIKMIKTAYINSQIASHGKGLLWQGKTLNIDTFAEIINGKLIDNGFCGPDVQPDDPIVRDEVDRLFYLYGSEDYGVKTRQANRNKHDKKYSFKARRASR